MSEEKGYFAPAGRARSSFSVKRSRFIATLLPMVSEKSLREALETVRADFPDATHHTYACRIGSESSLSESTSDDREPAGTAGLPMLQVLQGRNVSDALIIATRYYGGTKLGIGGLTRAYRDCARRSLEEAKLIRKEALSTFRLGFAYEDYGSVIRVIEANGGTVISTAHAPQNNIIAVSIPTRLAALFISSYQSACRGRGSLHPLDL